MREFKKKLLESPVSKLPNNSLLWANSDRLQRGSVPDIARFRSTLPPVRFALHSSALHGADGLIIWKNIIAAQVIDILWIKQEIICVLFTQDRNRICRFSFVPIQRFASYEGILKLMPHFFLARSTPVHNVISSLLALRMLLDKHTMYPSPRDINKVLVGTGMLNPSTAHPHVPPAWERLLKDHDRRISLITRRIEILEQKGS